MKYEHLTPQQIVEELDKYIIGQGDAKRSVAIALRNRWRRQQVTGEIRDEIMPNNIIMIGSTGIGKTEIARRLASLSQAPFIKVEASKFTEVGYVGRDVESMIRDLADVSYNIVKTEHENDVQEKAIDRANDRIMDYLLTPVKQNDEEIEEYSRYQKTRNKLFLRLMAGDYESREIEITMNTPSASMQVFGPAGMEDLGINLQDMLENAIPKKKQTRRLSVAEARKFLTQEELDRLLDQEKIKAEAVVRLEQAGIVFLDEIDKIASSEGGRGPDVSREGVQRDILPIVEGTSVKTKYGIVKTDHVLFIAAGAFHMTKPSDLIPELQGRFPIRVELDNLTKEDFVKILTQPKSALIKQYTALLESESATITFTKTAIDEISRVAFEVNERIENIGARRLQTIMSRLLEDVMFELPERAEKVIKITKKNVQDAFKDSVEDIDLSKYIL
jgi:ATP-dependent HslUV protease ATP-binding subunit HslU